MPIYKHYLTEPDAMPEKPNGVTILGILGIVGGVILILAGLGVPGSNLGVISIITGIVDLILGVGCFKAWLWVWPTGIAFSALSISAGLVSIFMTGIRSLFGAVALPGVIIGLTILYYLVQPQVKVYLGISKPEWKT